MNSIMPDRNKAPEFKKTENAGLITPEINLLDNGIPLYLINSGTENIISIEFIFDAGTWFESQHLISLFTNIMITEGGTLHHSAYEISELFEYYGASIESNAGKDTASISLSTLTKHLEHLIPLIENIIYEPAFPEEELLIQTSNAKQKHLINIERPNILAGRSFNRIIFGDNSPYGYFETATDYDKIYPKLLFDFHKNFYINNNLSIIASGKIPSNFTELMNKYFGNKVRNKDKYINTGHTLSDAKRNNVVINKKNVVQDSLRIGKLSITRDNPDWHGVKVLTTLLGGYFGSRLMKNIREDKGLTYGIYAFSQGLRNKGAFVIGAETSGDKGRQAADEVYNELNKLCTEKPGDEELELVRNYLSGELQRGFDGPLSSAEMIKIIIKNKLDFDYYQKYFNTILNISADEIHKLAVKYLQSETMTEVIVTK